MRNLDYTFFELFIVSKERQNPHKWGLPGANVYSNFATEH